MPPPPAAPSEPSPSDSSGWSASAMLACSWPGPSTGAWQRDGHIRSLQSSGGGAWWHGWGPCRISRTLTPSQPGWPLLEGRAPQVCSGTLSGMLAEGNGPRDLLTAWHYTEHGERAGSRTNKWCGGEIAWRCQLVCEHGVWEKPKEVSSPVRQLLVKGIISNPENPPQESHGCQAQGRCPSH